MKRFLSIILSISMTLGLFVNPVFASETAYTSEPQISAESSQIEAEGKDSAGQMIADAISKQAAEQNSDAACHISGLTIDKENMTAEVSFVTDEDAEVMVSIFSGKQSALYASGKQKVTPAEHSTTVKIACRDGINSVPDTFTGKAYLLDRDSHEPLCDPFTTSEYTKEIMDLKAFTTEDFPEDRVLNLDSDTETNFAVYSDEISVIEENAGKNQITDNGDGTYTVTNADSSFTSLISGDKLSYTDSDGNVLLLTVSKISVNGSTVTIWKETKEEDLTDYFDYLKIEVTDQNVPLDIDESTMDEGVEFLGCDVDTQGELPAAGAEGEGSLSHSLAFQIKKKIHKTEDDKAGVDIKGELNLQLKSTLKYYLSANYQELLFKIDCSISVSGEISGKLEEKLPLARVEIPILPCVSAGFTPAFVVRGTGAVKWTLEWKETVGVAYDTKNGCRDAGEAPTTTAKAEISKTIFVGIEATPYVCIVNENLCKTSLETSAGIEVKRTQSGNLDNTKIHKCKDCIAGSVKCKVMVKVKLDLVKGTVSMEAVLVSLEAKLFDYYRSATYNESGYGSCSHVYYKTKISVDDKSGTAVPQAWITPMRVGDNGPAAVKFLTDKDSPEITSVSAGTDGTAVVYLQKGDYVFHAKTDELSCKKEAEIKARSEYTNEVNLTMDTRTYPVTVKVQDGSGNPVADMAFNEKDPETGKTLTVEGKTDTDGKAEIRLPLGTHTIEARNSSYKGSSEITVTKDTNTLTITVEEIKYGTINLIAVDGDGNVVSGAAISGGNLSAFLRTDSSGRANFRAEVGPLIIHVKKDKASGDAAVEVVEGTQDVTVVLDDGKATVNLTVVDENGKAVQGASISVSNLTDTFTTDSNGKTKFRVEPGQISVCARKDGYYVRESFSVKKENQTIELKLEVTHLLTVNVIDENGKPVKNATVTGLDLKEDSVTNVNGVVTINAPKGKQCVEAYTDSAFGYGSVEINDAEEKLTISLNETNFFWTLNGGKMRIFGSGKMPDGSVVHEEWLPWQLLNLTITDVVIEEGITNLGYRAFYDCYSLKNVKMADTVTDIGVRSFECCENLENIKISEAVTNISDYAFIGCSSLENVDIPESVIKIGIDAFRYCNSLKSIRIPDSVTDIDYRAFWGCSSLENVVLSDSMTVLKADLFYYCSNLKSVQIPNSVTKIDYAFTGCSSLESIWLPGSVEEINGAFRGCSSLKSIRIPDSVTKMKSAFSGCSSLESIYVPDSVTDMDTAFAGCSKLKNVNISNSVTGLWETFARCSSLESIYIPDSVTIIEYEAFYECNNLKNVRLSESLEKINDYAFMYCSSLESIQIPDSAWKLGWSVFNGCSKLKAIVLSEKMSDIGNSAFKNCTSLESIVLPDKNITIRASAFEGCTNLKKVETRKPLTYIETKAFKDCINLKQICIAAVSYVADDAFENCPAAIIQQEATSASGTDDTFSDSAVLETEDELSETDPSAAASDADGLTEIILTDEDNEEAVSGEDIFDSEEVIPETEADTEDTTEANTEEQETSAPAADLSDISDDPEATVTVMEKETYGAQARVAVNYWNDLLETNLVPGERYLMVYVCRKDEDDLLNSKNVYYMEQKTADEEGTILFKYPLMVFASGPSAPTRTDPEIYVYGPSAENNLSDANVEISPLTENGTWQSPEIEVGYRGKYLTEDVDYRVSGDLNVNEAGEYSVLIKGRGNYSGRIRVYFTVNEKDVSEDPADHEHRYTASYQWEKTADGQMSCTVVWDCTVNNCGAESVTDADVTRTGTYCTGFIYKASAVLDGVMYTDTYREAGAGHSWTSWKTVSAATVFQAAKQTRTCQRCKIFENRTSGSKLKPIIQTNANSFPLKVKQTTTKLKVTGLAAGDRIVSWKSSNPKILTVTANGKLKAGKKTGKATLTITLASGLKKQIKVKVQKKAVKTTKISVSQMRIVLKKGKKQLLRPVITPITSLQKITFSSSNKKIVSVNKKGQITARKKGRAKITIRSGSKKKVVTVTVK
ncbi:leucine-rich repeat protein [Blautia sp. HCP28S3_G10]|uniref:leucine-rich repeat protein n=1 Tax=Blautia sp. HCP28S3_G10 TaxID=3438908 RepID=UPI003F8C0159